MCTVKPVLFPALSRLQSAKLSGLSLQAENIPAGLRQALGSKVGLPFTGYTHLKKHSPIPLPEKAKAENMTRSVKFQQRAQHPVPFQQSTVSCPLADAQLKPLSTPPHCPVLQIYPGWITAVSSGGREGIFLADPKVPGDETAWSCSCWLQGPWLSGDLLLQLLP